jgi:pentatricopeptide repeat protein
LTRVPLLTILLPGFSYPASSQRKNAPQHRRTWHKHDLPPAGVVEEYLLSALTQAGSCQSRRCPASSKSFATQKKDAISHRVSQRRWISAFRAIKSQSDSRSAKTVNPANGPEVASSSETRPSPPQDKHESVRRDDLEGESSFFKPFYEEVDHRGPREEQGANRAKEQKQPCTKLNGSKNTRHEHDGARPDDMEDAPSGATLEETPKGIEQELIEQIRYLKSVRELERKLEKARNNLHISMRKGSEKRKGSYWQEEAYKDQGRIEMMDLTEVEMAPPSRPVVKLKKEDFLGLVDLYFYSHRTRFLSEAPDLSPTPLQLDDFSFKVSEDFSPPTNRESDLVRDEEGTPVSPLYHVEAEIKAHKLNEIKALQSFVDLLLDDYSPLKDLFRAYKALPQPGVSYLSGGVIRLFLQRMSTPWKSSEQAMLRYLSLLDDMQVARLPITAWEWSSAIYLSGQSFSNVATSDVAAAFRVWRQMEKDAGVAARAVTFNILFDIAVKAEKFVLAEEILREMHDRGFRLNRLGRVGLIYYYGKKGDGDGVRKAYRDFVEAGEVVDTLVLNCVMASLINAQEPAAAEQIYERMKGMQERLRRGTNADGEEALFLKYPPPGAEKIGTEMASNSLGRVLLNASRLETTLPEHHAELQNIMPLSPDAITFRTLIHHHARTSGNIDRLTVLLDDMTRQFRIPITDLTFQFLFKGFAMHGGSDRSDAKWTQQRLQIAWAACVLCIKASKAKDVATNPTRTHLDLPSVEDAQAMAAEDEQRAKEEASKQPKPRRPTAWAMFLKQFTTPYPETRPFDLYSSSTEPSEPPSEDEVGFGEEYRLPPVDLTPKVGSSDDPADMKAFQPTKHLVLWVIRAFTRCTANRSTVEDVWYQIKGIWRPPSLREQAVAIRELRRALRYCDNHGRK